MFSLGYLVQRLMIQIRRIVIGLRLPQRTLGKRLIRRVPVALQRQKRGRRVDFTSICSASKQALWNASWLFSSAALVMASQ